jgi:hypothetical protein
MAVTANLGFGSALDYWHQITNRAFMRFKEAPTRENAIECAKAIEDLRDWLWTKENPGVDSRAMPDVYRTFNQGLFAECPDLAIIKDIAEFAKHGGQLGRGSVMVKEIEGAGIGGLSHEGGPLGNYDRKPVCTLEAVLRDGSKKPIPEMLSRAVLYWRDRLSASAT